MRVPVFLFHVCRETQRCRTHAAQSGPPFASYVFMCFLRSPSSSGTENMQSVQLRFVTVLGALLAASLAAPATLCAKTKLDWDPEHTWVFAAGILEWEHSDIYASF